MINYSSIADIIFEKGKWYKNLGTNNSIAKFHHLEDDKKFYCSEYFYEEEKIIKYKPALYLVINKDTKLCSEEEIQKLLPKDHPDRLETKYYECVEAFNNFTVGKIYKTPFVDDKNISRYIINSSLVTNSNSVWKKHFKETSKNLYDLQQENILEKGEYYTILWPMSNVLIVKITNPYCKLSDLGSHSIGAIGDFLENGKFKTNSTFCHQALYNPRTYRKSTQEEIDKLNSYLMPLKESSIQNSVIKECCGLKVGDFLDADIISKWGKINSNYTIEDIDKVWVTMLTSFIDNRHIEKFKNIQGEIGFLVSGTKTVYLKAEGFKEFSKNFFNKTKEKIEEFKEPQIVLIKVPKI